VKNDASGNVFITGYFSGTVDFDPNAGVHNLTSSATSSDAYVFKLDPSGNLSWADAISGSGSEYVNALDTDPMGNILLGGSFDLSSDFDPGAGTLIMTSAGSNDGFVAKLDNSGGFVWARRLGGTSNDTDQGLAVDIYGNIYSTGFTDGTIDLDPGAGVINFTTSGYQDIFISKLDSGGNYSWGGKMGSSTAYDTGFALEVDSAGNVYSTGCYAGTADMDPNVPVFNLTANPAAIYDIYVQKLNQAALGIADSEEKLPFVIYPNPAHDQLLITTAVKTEISIIDLLGREVINSTIENQSEMDVSSLTNGVYFIRDLKTGATVKFIKN
jgi:hypothetical protein